MSVMSLDEESSQASKKGRGSDALCIMERGEASSSFSELLQIQRDASPVVGAASSRTAGTVASGTQLRSAGAIMRAKLHAFETRDTEEHTHSSLFLFPNSGKGEVPYVGSFRKGVGRELEHWSRDGCLLCEP